MIKDLTGLLTKKFNELVINETVELGTMQRTGDEIVFSKPVELNGRLYRLEDGVVFFSGDLKTVVTTACYRCLEPVTEAMEIEFDEAVFAPGKEDDYDLIVEPEGETFNSEDFIINILDLKMPLKFLCDEECKGLCPVCGTNLNTSECSCKEKEVDPRFAVLKNLFNDSNL